MAFYLTSNEYQHYLPIGSVEYMKKACEILEINLPKPLNIPYSLRPYCGRKIWESTIDNLNFPCFIKPLTDVKLFTGFVAKSKTDFILYPELKDFNGEVMCSEPIDNILSEWRCYVLDKKVVNCSNYSGDPLAFPDRHKIYLLIEKFYDAPIGYSLDVCVTNTDTILIEVNDGWALGNYGCEHNLYYKILKKRWFEIIKLNENNEL